MATINGTSSRDYLYGRSANDVIHGWGGDDYLYGRNGNDTLYGEKGADVLYGEGGRDRLYGGPGDDYLFGGAGSDRLQGGPGNDRYYGGDADGADRFVFSDVTSNGSTTEYVADFDINDVIDFSSIDANWNVAGNQAFRWLGEGDFTGRGGEMVYRFLGEGTGQYTRLYLDVDGNKAADMIVTLDNGWFGIRPTDDWIVL